MAYTDFTKDSSRFVVLGEYIPDIVQEIRYYSSYNFVGERIDGYEEPIALLTKDAARAAAYKKLAEKQIRALASKKYLARPGENGFFLLKHSVGSLPGKSEVDVPLSYADYYFLEAINRFNALEK